MQFHGFDWDEGNRFKCRKHGVSVAEIEDLLTGGPCLHPDPSHSAEELRIRAIGTARNGRWIFLAFTFRRREERLLVRPISARYMHAKEILHYAKAQAASRSDER